MTRRMSKPATLWTEVVSMSITRRLGFAARISFTYCVTGADDAFDEHRHDLLRRGRVHPAVERKYAERGDGVGLPGTVQRFPRRTAYPRAARVCVLDDHTARVVEVDYQAPRGVEVEDVVERKLLALDLPRRRPPSQASIQGR